MPAVVWLVIGLVALAIEIFTTDFTFLMLGAACLAAAGTAVAIDNIWIQVLVFAVVAASLLLLVRPWAKNRFNTRGSKVGSAEVLIGKEAVAVTDVDTQAGRVKISGDVWSARSVSGPIASGTRVRIAAIDGATAVVEAVGTDAVSSL